MAQGLIGNGQDFHAVLQHFVHNGTDAGKAVCTHDAALASILHVAAPRTHSVNTTLDQEQLLLPLFYQSAGQLPVVVKGKLVQLSVLRFQCLKMVTMPRHIPTCENGIIQMIAHSGMVQAVQIGKVQHLLAFVAQHVHIILQGNAIPRQGSGFIHTEHIHTAKALHGINVFHHRLLFAHGRAAFGQTGVDDHGEQFRSQTHGHR